MIRDWMMRDISRNPVIGSSTISADGSEHKMYQNISNGDADV
jgi:hypothetical protein